MQNSKKHRKIERRELSKSEMQKIFGGTTKSRSGAKKKATTAHKSRKAEVAAD